MTKIEIDETFDSNGNLISRIERTVEVIENPMDSLVATLTAEQRELLLAALQASAS